MKKSGPIAQGLRKEYDRLVQKHGLKGLTPVYQHAGVFCFDWKVSTHRPSGASDLASIGKKKENASQKSIGNTSLSRMSEGGASASASSGAWTVVPKGRKANPVGLSKDFPRLRK